MTEKLLESTKTDLPKIKLALEPDLKKAGEEAEAKRIVPPAESSLPNPTGWRIMVLPFQPKVKTKGGILLAEAALERQQIGTVCGLVLGMGPDCYRDKNTTLQLLWCKVNICFSCRSY